MSLVHTQFGSLADTLRTALCLYQLPCEHTDGYSRPEIEFRDNKHLILPSIELGSKQDEVLIEIAINSVRISLKVHWYYFRRQRNRHFHSNPANFWLAFLCCSCARWSPWKIG